MSRVSKKNKNSNKSVNKNNTQQTKSEHEQNKIKKMNKETGKLQIEIKLLSETIFGSGETVSNSVDIEVLHNELGIPYMKGKTFKGKLREEVEEATKLLQISTGKNFKTEVDALFGQEGGYSDDKSNILSTLKFSNCEISENIRNMLGESIKTGQVSKEEILGAFTDVRSFTSIGEDGIAKDGSLRQGRVVKKDIKYYVDLNIGRNLTNIEKGLLAAGVSSLRNIGAMESRGKGRVEGRLLEDGKDVTLDYIKELEEEVK